MLLVAAFTASWLPQKAVLIPAPASRRSASEVGGLAGSAVAFLAGCG
ncbi:hypothetical protein ABGB18_28500 [Nonomuraea sp. B12E4]